jgi:excisionase family DNA binding protein
MSDIIPAWLTVDGSATYASLSTKSIRRLISSGKLTAHRPVRGRVLIDRDELDSVIRSSTQQLRRGRGIRR